MKEMVIFILFSFRKRRVKTSQRFVEIKKNKNKAGSNFNTQKREKSKHPTQLELKPTSKNSFISGQIITTFNCIKINMIIQ